jgi:hypothetical protein
MKGNHVATTVQVDPYVGLKDRDYFHIMLNLDSFDGFLPTARSMAEKFLSAARQRQKDPTLEAELRPFAYAPQAFQLRLDQIYQGLADDVAQYEATQGWASRTRDDVIDWILQMAPFNQTDGSWLRMIVDVGPMDDVHSLLFSIYVDELGGGNADLNHANLYTKLLRSVGFELPNIRSRAYVDNQSIVDSAFTLPLFQLVVSQFPQDCLPELLGMTLYLEWGSVELQNMVLLNGHFGLDPHFYEVHVAIDNASTGHGAMAFRAIALYLEQVRIEAGDDAVQEQWQRVWDGYVAFATTGDLANDVAARRSQAPSPADKVAAIIADRAPKARLNHGTKRLGGALINDLFADPPSLMKALIDGGVVSPGDPEHSRFFALTTPDGPMFRIFSDAELGTWREWIASIGSETEKQPSTSPAPPPPIAVQMQELIDTLREQQQGTAAHQGVKLVGDDPQSPGQLRSESVAWWFDQRASAFMAALARPENEWVVSGDAESSRLVTQVIRSNNAMARLLQTKPSDGGSGAEIIAAWINARCPLPVTDTGVRPITLLSPPDRIAAHPTGDIHGAGSTH